MTADTEGEVEAPFAAYYPFIFFGKSFNVVLPHDALDSAGFAEVFDQIYGEDGLVTWIPNQQAAWNTEVDERVARVRARETQDPNDLLAASYQRGALRTDGLTARLNTSKPIWEGLLPADSAVINRGPGLVLARDAAPINRTDCLHQVARTAQGLFEVAVNSHLPPGVGPATTLADAFPDGGPNQTAEVRATRKAFLGAPLIGELLSQGVAAQLRGTNAPDPLNVTEDSKWAQAVTDKLILGSAEALQLAAKRRGTEIDEDTLMSRVIQSTGAAPHEELIRRLHAYKRVSGILPGLANQPSQ